MSQTTLTASVAATDASIEVDSPGDLRGDKAPPYRLAVNHEEMTVTEEAGDILTVVRDQSSLMDIFATDAFDREEPAGTRWNYADDAVTRWRGATTTADVDFSVTGGKGVIGILTPSTGASPMFETTAPLLEVQVRYRFSIDALDAVLDAYVRTGTDPNQNSYRARLVIDGAGALTLRLAKNVAGAATNLVGSVTPAGGPLAVDEEWNLALQATGSGTTSLAAKAWRTADGEPAAWQTTASDTEAILQTANMTALRFAPTPAATALIDDYTVARIPVGLTHTAGDVVVLVEEWPYPSQVVVGIGPPLSNPPSGAEYMDISTRPATFYRRVGAIWYSYP